MSRWQQRKRTDNNYYLTILAQSLSSGFVIKGTLLLIRTRV